MFAFAITQNQGVELNSRKTIMGKKQIFNLNSIKHLTITLVNE